MTLPSRANRTPLGAFVRSPLGVLGKGEEEEPELEFASTFRITLEIDEIQVWSSVSGTKVSTIAGSSVRRIVFDDFLEAGLDTAFLLGHVPFIDNNSAVNTIAEGFHPLDPFEFPLERRVRDEDRLASLIPTVVGDEIKNRTTRTTDATSAILEFDTDGKCLRTRWSAGNESAHGPLRGVLVADTQNNPAGGPNIKFGWTWAASLNPATFDSAPDYHEFRHYGRLIYESL